MKSKIKVIKTKNDSEEEYFNSSYIIPVVDHDEIEPKIKIWDANGEFYWYKTIGFNRDIRDN